MVRNRPPRQRVTHRLAVTGVLIALMTITLGSAVAVDHTIPLPGNVRVEMQVERLTRCSNGTAESSMSVNVTGGEGLAPGKYEANAWYRVNWRGSGSSDVAYSPDEEPQVDAWAGYNRTFTSRTSFTTGGGGKMTPAIGTVGDDVTYGPPLLLATNIGYECEPSSQKSSHRVCLVDATWRSALREWDVHHLEGGCIAEWR